MSEKSRLLSIAVLGICAILGTVGSITCALLARDISPALSAVTGTCLGALGGLLSHPPVAEASGEPPPKAPPSGVTPGT